MLQRSAIILLVFCVALANCKDCFDDETQLGEKCYTIVDSAWLNWYQAARYCAKKNLKLLTIESEEEYKLIGEHLLTLEYTNEHASDSPHYFWTAGTNLGQKNNQGYYWQSTGKDMTYTIWSEGEPNNKHGIEHCAVLWPEHQTYSMNDAPCQQHSMYICERPKDA